MKIEETTLSTYIPVQNRPMVDNVAVKATKSRKCI